MSGSVNYEQKLSSLSSEQTPPDTYTESKLSELIGELTKLTKAPNHTEVVEVYRGAKEMDRVAVAQALMQQAVEKIGKRMGDTDEHGHEASGEPATFKLARAENRGEDINLGDIDLNAKKVTPGEPQIFVQQIYSTKKASLFDRAEKRVLTDEVLVVVRLNNSKKPDENTVITFVTTQSEGKIRVDKQAFGLWAITSAATFMKAKEGEASNENTFSYNDNTAIARMYRGELGHKEYKQSFEIEHKQSYRQYWDQWDKDCTRKFDHWVSNERRAQLMERLGGRYTELLERTQQRRKQVVEQVKARLNEHKSTLEEIKHDVLFMLLHEIASDTRETPNRRNSALRALKAKYPAVSDSEWKELLA